MIQQGEIKDAKTMVGFMTWQRYYKGKRARKSKVSIKE